MTYTAEGKELGQNVSACLYFPAAYSCYAARLAHESSPHEVHLVLVVDLEGEIPRPAEAVHAPHELPRGVVDGGAASEVRVAHRDQTRRKRPVTLVGRVALGDHPLRVVVALGGLRRRRDEPQRTQQEQ